MLLCRLSTEAGTLYRSEREGIVSSVGWTKWSVSGGGGLSSLLDFSSWGWELLNGDGLYGGGASSSSSGVCWVVVVLDVAESYEGGSRRPCGMGLDASLATWQYGQYEAKRALS